MSGTVELSGPNLEVGVSESDLAPDGCLVGHAHGEPVMLVRRGEEVFAVGATCTHYGGPLSEGLVEGDSVRCPWHHACFSLRTGEAVAAPALNPIPCFDIERREQRLYVLGKRRAREPVPVQSGPSQIVIVGGGAAGHAAAEMLRREGYAGKLTLLSAEPVSAVDRPNLSKDYLAGTAPEEWMPLRPPEFFVEQKIDLQLGVRVARVDVARQLVVATDDREFPYDALLLATGAEPTHLSVPGSELPHVLYVRTLADSRGIIARLSAAKRAVVIGSGFIGLEVAASLRKRGLEVHVVTPDLHPLGKVLPAQLGALIQRLHEEHGVVFHFGRRPTAITPQAVMLDDGSSIAAELVVVGIGVRPELSLAESAGLALERGVKVDAYLQTSVPGIFAAGDIARWPDPHSEESIRVEHWVVAQRQGQIAARNMLGQKVPCDFVPFFWSQHYDVTLSYVGHASSWDAVDVDGSIEGLDCRVALKRSGKVLAVVTINRDRESLRAEISL